MSLAGCHRGKLSSFPRHRYGLDRETISYTVGCDSGARKPGEDLSLTSFSRGKCSSLALDCCLQLSLGRGSVDNTVLHDLALLHGALLLRLGHGL